MAIISLQEYHDGSTEWSSTQHKNERKYTRTWLAISNDVNDGGVSIVAAFITNTGIAQGTAYSTTNDSDPGSFCQSISAERKSDDGLSWIITAQYGQYAFGSTSNDPCLLPCEVSWTFQQFQAPALFWTGPNAGFGTPCVYPVMNTANCPYYPPLMRDYTRPVLQIRQNEYTFAAQHVYNLIDTTNGYPIWNCGTRSIKVANIGATKMWDKVYGTYWQVTYEFQFRYPNWDETVPSTGLMAIDPADNKLKHIKGNDGEYVSTPQYLDANGQWLDPSKQDGNGNPIYATPNNFAQAIVTQTFQTYPTTNFSTAFSFRGFP